jgi:hypothetical protein
MTENSKTDSPGTRTVTMKKPHACGGTEFAILKMGPEVTLRCLTCTSLVRMKRERFYRASTLRGGQPK